MLAVEDVGRVASALRVAHREPDPYEAARDEARRATTRAERAEARATEVVAALAGERAHTQSQRLVIAGLRYRLGTAWTWAICEGAVLLLLLAVALVEWRIIMRGGG